MNEDNEINEIQAKVDKLQNILYCFEKRDRKEFIDVFKDYFICILKIMKNFKAENNSKFLEFLRKVLCHTQISYKEFCLEIKSFISISGVTVMYRDKQGNMCIKEFYFDFVGYDVNLFINLFDVEKMMNDCECTFGEITVMPLRSNVKNTFERIEHTLKMAPDNLSYNDQLREANKHFVRFLDFKQFETDFASLKTTKKYHREVVERRKLFESSCVREKLKIELGEVSENYETAADCLPLIHLMYFTLIRKACYVRSTLKPEDAVANVSLQEQLQKLVADYRSFNSTYSFFFDSPTFNFPLDQTFSAHELEFDLESILSLGFMEEVRSVIGSYESNISSFNLKMNTAKMNVLLSEIKSVKSRLDLTRKCELCLENAKTDVKELQKKYNFNKISSQIFEIVTRYNELLQTTKRFDHEYKPLYLVNENESFIYNSNELVIDDVCYVCLEEYEDGDAVVRLNCSHHFCKQHIVDWVREQMSNLVRDPLTYELRHQEPSCPVCRETIEFRLVF